MVFTNDCWGRKETVFVSVVMRFYYFNIGLINIQWYHIRQNIKNLILTLLKSYPKFFLIYQ